MPNGARLVIVELLLPERANDDPAAIMLDLHMMTITGGRARSLAQFAALLADADLALSNVTPTRLGLVVIEAVLPLSPHVAGVTGEAGVSAFA